MSLIKPRGAASLPRPVGEVSLPALRPALYERLRGGVQINKQQLDKVIEQQSDTFMDVSDEVTAAVSRRDLLRDELSRLDAELARAERGRLALAKEKTTESMINDAVMLHPAHIRKSADLAEAKAEADKWLSLKAAYEMRAKMVKELVSLYTSGYWTTQSLGGSRPHMSDKDYKDVLSRADRQKGAG